MKLIQDNKEMSAKLFTSSHKRISSLDVVRGISALMIVLYHYTTQYDISIGHIGVYPFKLSWGCYAVHSFFILSGFLTLYQLKPDTKPRDFLIKRGIRLYPVFWICILVTTLYMAVLLPERLRTGMQILLNFTMVPNLLGIDNVDGVYWTLEKELMFYIIIALLLKAFGKNFKKFLKNGGGLLWFALLIAATFYASDFVDLPAQSLVRFLFITEYAQTFLIGIYICLLSESAEKKERITLVVQIVMCLIYTAVVKGRGQAVFVTIVTIIVSLLVFQELNDVVSVPAALKMAAKPFRFIANISYPLYLTHQFIGFAIIKILEEKLNMTNELFLFIPLGHAIVLAAIIHYFLEVPVGKKLRKLSERRA